MYSAVVLFSPAFQRPITFYRDGLAILAALHLEEPTTLISPFDVLLVDLILSGDIDGVQVIQQVRMKYPDLLGSCLLLCGQGRERGEEYI